MAKFQCNVISYVLRRTVDITVVIPSTTIPESMDPSLTATHVVKEKYPVLYLLHGYGNNHATWSGYTNVEMFAEERNIAVVMISGENKFYRAMPNGDDFFKFVSEEVPEFVTNYFPISSNPQHSYIAGLSMGGYGALLHGLTHPERFAAIGAFSAAVMPMGDPEEIKGLTDGPLDVSYLAKQAAAAKTPLPPLYISCGEDDFLYKLNSDFKDMLAENHVDVTWVSLPGYTHEWRFWNLQVEQFLDWIPRTDGYATQGKRKI